MGPKATVFIKDSGFIQTERLVLEEPPLQYLSAGQRNFTIFPNGKLTGGFGAINMNDLPYVIEYHNYTGVITAVLSASPLASSPSSSNLSPLLNCSNLEYRSIDSTRGCSDWLDCARSVVPQSEETGLSIRQRRSVAQTVQFAAIKPTFPSTNEKTLSTFDFRSR